MSGTSHTGSDPDARVEDEIERTKDEAGRIGRDLGETARERGRATLEQAKERAAERAEDLASEIDAAADDLGSGDGSETLSGYGRSMASMMRRFAGGLREQEIEEFAGQLAGFARRNPASFLAGSVALGFGISRFLKASSQRAEEQYDLEDEYGYETDEESEMPSAEAAGSAQPEIPGEAVQTVRPAQPEAPPGFTPDRTRSEAGESARREP